MGKADQEFMPAEEYGRSLAGLGINLLVRDIARAVDFAERVLGATPVYADQDFAVLRYTKGRKPAEWMLHKDPTYHAHPMLGLLNGVDIRGAGAELRLHDCDPDLAAAKAKELGHVVLAEAMDKPHGQREAFILDPDGYCWVPGIPR